MAKINLALGISKPKTQSIRLITEKEIMTEIKKKTIKYKIKNLEPRDLRAVFLRIDSRYSVLRILYWHTILKYNWFHSIFNTNLLKSGLELPKIQITGSVVGVFLVTTQQTSSQLYYYSFLKNAFGSTTYYRAFYL